MDVKPGTRRVIESQSLVYVQIRQADGTWWNLRSERSATPAGQELLRGR